MHGRIDSIERVAGGLRADARLTRTGVFDYVSHKEWRPEAEVFAADSLATLKGAPLTIAHPSSPVDARNVHELAIGYVGDDVRRDGVFIVASLFIFDGPTCLALEYGKLSRELSCGYTVDLEPKSGVFAGEHYDEIQRRIRYNHVAIVDVGRAGPDVRVLL